MPDIQIRSLTHAYSRGTPFEKVALDHISLDIPAGQYAALLGRTGSGKSTLIQHLNGLLSPSEGQILFDGEDVFASKVSLRRLRFRVGLVFQYPEYQLFEETVWKDIAFGPRNMGLSESEIEEHVRFGARLADVPEELFSESPLEISGGQKRRVAIAGVFSMQPEVLILDEPLAGLDPEGCRSLLKNIDDYRRATGCTVLLVTHDMDAAARCAERLIVLEKGRLLMDGTPHEIFSRTDELRRAGLDVPDAASLALALRLRGIDLGESVYTPQQLCDAVLRIKEARKC